MRFEFAGRQFDMRYWHPERGTTGEVVAFDTETAPIEVGSVPAYVTGQAYAGGSIVWLVPLEHTRAFLDAHSSVDLVMHHAPFDTAVLEQETGFDFDAQIRANRLHDTAILYRLLKLATEGDSPTKWALDVVAKELLGVTLAKDDKVRLSFGKYRHGDLVNYGAIPADMLRYAMIDSVATFQIHKTQIQRIKDLGCRNLLGHKIALMGAWALARVSTRGIGLDRSRRDYLIAQLDSEIPHTLDRLAAHGYVPGTKGVQSAFERIVRTAHIELPKTDSGKVSRKKKDLKSYRHFDFIDAYLAYEETRKLRDTFKGLNSGRVYSTFNHLLRTGRTSSSKPNIQNLPRRSGVRECFVPAPGHCFLIIDFKQLELVTLAQVCLDLFGTSRMADLVNAGEDLHLWFASVVAGRSVEKDSDERRYAKAANFGFPGGLGVRSFVAYARDTWGITDMTEQHATDLRNKWLEAFPEMRQYLEDRLVPQIAPLKPNWCKTPEAAAALFKRIMGGERRSKAGRPYDRDTLKWAFGIILPRIAPHLAGARYGSADLLEEISLEDVTTRTGRVRARASYCAARNTRFQGLASDGAKVALYRLERAGYRSVAFVHDEYVIELPLTSDLLKSGEEVKQIVCGAMRAVVPDVEVDADWAIADRWYKTAKLLRSESGEVRIYSHDSKTENRLS